MRVTRLIRDYVEKSVKANYPKSAEELAWEEQTKKMNEAIAEGNALILEYQKKIAEELNAKYGFDKEYCLCAYDHYNTVRSNNYGGDSPLYEAYRKARDERENKIFDTNEEILLTLELGGTKADLDEMLKNIGK